MADWTRLERKARAVGLHIPKIYLPSPDAADLERWAVIACDQYTSDPDYWRQVAALAGESPSTLSLILPEAFLNAPDLDARIDRINRTMRDYLDTGILTGLPRGCVLTDRRTPFTASRKGLVVALDLEAYDYHPDALTLTRATEETVLNRIPPRVRIRRNAPLELPHIMLLIDDPGHTVIEPVLALSAQRFPPLYDTDLMLGSGHLTGYPAGDPAILKPVLDALAALGADPSRTFLYAVGDGNHSLAAAKTHWEVVKASLPPQTGKDLPARFALVEIVNLHDPGLSFHPIHRIVFRAFSPSWRDEMAAWYRHAGMICLFHNGDEAFKTALSGEPDASKLYISGEGVRRIAYVTAESRGALEIGGTEQALAYGALQPFLDQWPYEKDYIHGDEALIALASQPGNIGFLMPPLAKERLFSLIAESGVLPRKSFSMGEAPEKRFYMECRKIIP